MQKEVIKIGNASFLSQTDKTIIKRILNSDFEINDDFSGGRSKLSFDASSQSSLVEEGMLVTSNSTVINIIPVKIYLAKYRKGECYWNDVVYYGILEDSTDAVLDKWEFLYTNEQYCSYRIFSRSLPTTLPFDGVLPPIEKAPFIKYESFNNTWQRKQCQFKYSSSPVSFSNAPGKDEWTLVSSGKEECVFSYIKSTPFGCNFDVPNTADIQITDECACTDESSSSSESSVSSSTLMKSSSSSNSSESSDSSETSSVNSSSSEVRMSPKNIETLYIRLVGEPFVASHYVLKLQNPSVTPLVWTASTHAVDTLTTGTISLSMNASGRFLLSANVIVNGSKVVITNALLSNIRNDNFSCYSSYIKGLGPISSQYITTKYTANGITVYNYDCIVSYESMKRNNGSAKNISEIIFDYEMAALSVDDESAKINLYFGKANIQNEISSNDKCRAWGFFCLDYVSSGVWKYVNDEQEIKLSKSDAGCWKLYRKYMNSSTETEEIELEIDPKSVTQDVTGEYSGFEGTSIVPRYDIKGGVEETSSKDICNDKDTVVVFYSSDECMQDPTYLPYDGNLALTIDGGGWDGKTSYVLNKTIINENLSVWNWSSGSNADYFEYGVFFSSDGILWKLILSKKIGNSRSYLFSEFIKENKKINSFSPVFHKLHKSYISLNGNWGSSEATITISGIK